jgi:hypothetical protein
MKKLYLITLIVFATLAIFLGLYYIQYPIRLDKASLELEIQDFEEYKDIKIQNVKVIDNKIIAIYTFNDGMGYATFNTGLNRRGILTSTQNNSGSTFLIGDIYTEKGKYKIFAGKNYDNKINLIEFTATDQKNLKKMSQMKITIF